MRIPGPRARAWLGALIAAGTLVAAALIDRDLGVRHPPFVGNYAPRVSLWMLAAIPAFAAAVALVPRALRARPAVFALSLYAGTLVLRLLLAAARGGTEQWAHVFRLSSFEGPNEYLPALRSFAVRQRASSIAPRSSCRRFPCTRPGTRPACSGDARAGARHAGAVAAFCILAGAASAPLTYALGRHVSRSETRGWPAA